MSDLRLVKHVYYIPLGQGVPVCTELECSVCRTVLALSHCPGQPKPMAGADLREFAACTSPLGREKLFARLKVEERALASRLSKEERQQLLEEPFLALEYGAQVRLERGSDRSVEAVIGVLAMFGVLISMVLWASWDWKKTNTNAFMFWTVAVTLATAALIAWGAWRVMNGAKRVAGSRKVLSRIAQSLFPLRPTPSEIEQTLAVLRDRKSLLATGLQSGVILAALEELSRPPAGRRGFLDG